MYLFQQIWAGPLSGYRTVIVLVNRGPTRLPITALWEDIELPVDTVVKARDLWKVIKLLNSIVSPCILYSSVLKTLVNIDSIS